MKIILITILYLILLIYLGHDIYILRKSKGQDIRFTWWEKSTWEKSSYLEVIILYIASLLFLGLSIYLAWPMMSYENMSDQAIQKIFLGALVGLFAILILMQAFYIKYVLYVRKKNTDIE